MVLLQLKDPLELFVKKREFHPGYKFMSRRNMTDAVGSDVKPKTFHPSFIVHLNATLPGYADDLATACISKDLINWVMGIGFNPLTLRAAKTGLTILEIFYLQMHFLENIRRRNVHQKPHNKSRSNILQSFAYFLSYFRK